MDIFHQIFIRLHLSVLNFYINFLAVVVKMSHNYNAKSSGRKVNFISIISKPELQGCTENTVSKYREIKRTNTSE